MYDKMFKQIKEYVPFNDQEIKDKQSFLMFLTIFRNSLSRINTFGHVTSSAFVVNEDFTKALMVYHNLYNGFIYPGGHADDDADLFHVALKEVEEETGLLAKPFYDDNIFSIQINPVKGHVRKGEYVSTHIHFDVLYLLKVKNEDMDSIRIRESENSQVKWFPIDGTYGEDIIDYIRPVNEKIVKKVRTLDKF